MPPLNRRESLFAMAAALLLPTQAAAQSAGGVPQKFATPGFDFSNPERVVEIAEKIFAAYGQKIQRDKMKIDFEAATEYNPARFDFTHTDMVIDADGQRQPKLTLVIYSDDPAQFSGRDFHAGTHTRGIRLVIHDTDIKGSPVYSSLEIHEDLFLERLRVDHTFSSVEIDHVNTINRIGLKQFASSKGPTPSSMLELENAELFASNAAHMRFIRAAGAREVQEQSIAYMTYELTERGDAYRYDPDQEAVISRGREKLPVYARRRLIAEFVPTSLIAAKQKALVLIEAAKDAGLFGPVPITPAPRSAPAQPPQNDRLK